jgi:hypothetical protein
MKKQGCAKPTQLEHGPHLHGDAATTRQHQKSGKIAT